MLTILDRTAVVTGLLLRVAAAAGSKPNIVLIYADDLGYGDLSCNGATGVTTPTADRIAREGLNFHSAYAAAATCTPSRCSPASICFAKRAPASFRAMPT